MAKWKAVLISIGATIAAVGAVVAAFFLGRRPDRTVFENKRESFKVKRDEETTQVLPETPNMDKTLDDIEAHIKRTGKVDENAGS